MDNKLIKHFSIVGIGTAFSMLLGFFNAPIITRIVSPEAYGQYVLFTTYGNLLMSVIYLGLDQGFIRYFYNNEDKKYRQKLLYKSIMLPLFLLGFLFIISFFFLYSGFINVQISFPVFILFYLYVAIMLLSRYSNLLVRLQFHTKLYSALGIIQKATYLLFAVFLLVGLNYEGTLSLITAIILSNLLMLLIGLRSEKSMWNFTNIDSVEIKVTSKQLLKYSLPYVLASGITMLFDANDKLFIEYFGNLEELGVYSVSVSLIGLLNIFKTTFTTIWAPAALEHYSRDKHDRNFYQMGNRIITLLMFLLGFTIIIFKDVIAFILGAEYRMTVMALPTLLLGPIMYTISETTVSGITFKEKTGYHIIISVGALLTNVIGNILLVPTLGGQGAAISTGFAYIVFFTLRTFISNRLFYVDFKLGKFYFITFIFFLYALYNTFYRFSHLNFVLYIVCMILTILLYKESVVEILKYVTDYLKRFIKNSRETL